MITLHCTRPDCGHDEAQHVHYRDTYDCAAPGCTCPAWRHPSDTALLLALAVATIVWCVGLVAVAYRGLSWIAGWLS